MADSILSAGIDIGTTTTQVIFSRLTLETKGGWGSAPRVEVVGRDVIYGSGVYLTPLDGDDSIDSEGVAGLLRAIYEDAGVKPADLTTGAVIITGESARKRNAKDVTLAISELAGDFVVAAAGPDLESLLAAKGAGIDQKSFDLGKSILNIDIGGGTSNYCLFKNGEKQDCACFDIGGRVILMDDSHHIVKMTPKAEKLAQALGLDLKIGDELTVPAAEKFTDALAELLARGAHLLDEDETLKYFETNHSLSSESFADIITFSGGVADCMQNTPNDPYKYNDIGVFLAQAVKRSPAWKTAEIMTAEETMRATVIGAGSCSMEVSGSTTYCRNAVFPMKNYAVVKLKVKSDEDLAGLYAHLEKQLHQQELLASGYAIAVDGWEVPAFRQVEALADVIATALANEEKTIPIVLQQDFAKALGQSLKRRLPPDRPILCVDRIACDEGDFVDIGQPFGGGIAFPVVVKTLVFSKKG